MIYLFAGDDVKRKREAYESFLGEMPSEMAKFFIGRNNFDRNEVESFYSGEGLFFAKCGVIFEQVLEREEFLDFILSKFSALEKSGNDFVFLEGKLGKTELDAFRNARAELNVFELPKEKKEKYNNFLLADAFWARDKLKLWIYFRQAIKKGVGMEELIGVLFWKAKDMLLKRNFGKYKESELENFASKISFLLPEARKRGIDDEATFERFLLEVF